jgi:hypothetical protein
VSYTYYSLTSKFDDGPRLSFDTEGYCCYTKIASLGDIIIQQVFYLDLSE